jgi:arylsulfatase A-like enzyme
MVKRLDECYGRLRDALKSLALLEDTILLFVTDHGCHFKTRNSEYKRSGHESSIRIPCVATGPGFDGGGRVRNLISLIDLPPTLLDAAGIGVPAHFQGRSACPIIWDKKAEWPDDVYVQISEDVIARTLRTDRFKYIVTGEGDPVKEPASGTYVETELYDLQADPYELYNLVRHESHSKLRDVMRKKLLARMEAAGEKIPAILPPDSLVKPGQKVLYDHELPAVER